MRLIHIDVDLTEAPRGLLHTRVQLPVEPGSVAVFTTPLWIQESHRDNGPVAGIAGLHFASKGKTMRWHRNPTSPSEYHVEIPLGVDTIHAIFDAIVTRKVTRRIVMMGWEHVLLYPAHRDVRRIRIQASVTVPWGWRAGTALENLGQPILADTTDGRRGQTLLYQPTSLARLADSPVLAGLHFGQYAVTPDQRHLLCVAADTAEHAAVPRIALERLAGLVRQISAAFGARHYDTFRFLVALTDHNNPGGSEHHDSCDIALPLRALSDAGGGGLEQSGPVIAHEFIHSWNGKFRRPAGHLPHDFATPLDSRLLWVYEGLTEYYGGVLAVRAGFLSASSHRAELARAVARLQGQTGRLWRSTEDTCTGTSLRGSPAWANWARDGQDYYDEGVLLWLDVDTLIRSKTGGSRSLDHFTTAFFGRGSPTGPAVLPYTLKDVASCLDAVASNDWQAFFDAKVVGVSPRVNTQGIERAGYHFVFLTDKSGAGQEEQETENDTSDAIWNSIGVRLGERGQLVDVRRGSAADAAKLAPGQTVVRVGEAPFSLKTLATEISAKEDSPGSCIRLTMTQEGDEWLAELDYQAGLRYPRLERRPNVPDMLSAILYGG